jgi:hypothetical protein
MHVREFLSDSRSLRVLRLLPVVALTAVWAFSLSEYITVASPLIYCVIGSIMVPLDSLGMGMLFGQIVAFGTLLGLAVCTLCVYVMVKWGELGFYLLCGATALLLEPVLSQPMLGSALFMLVFLTIENVVMPLLPDLTRVPSALASETISALWQPGVSSPFANAAASAAACYAFFLAAYLLLPPVQSYLRIAPSLLHRALSSTAGLLRLLGAALRTHPASAADRAHTRSSITAGARALASQLLPTLPLAAFVAQMEPPLLPVGARALPLPVVSRIQVQLYKLLSVLSACTVVDVELAARRPTAVARLSTDVEGTPPDDELASQLQCELDDVAAQVTARRSLLPCCDRLRRRRPSAPAAHSTSASSSSIEMHPMGAITTTTSSSSSAPLLPSVLGCLVAGADVLDNAADVLDACARCARLGSGGFVARREQATALCDELEPEALFAEHEERVRLFTSLIKETILSAEVSALIAQGGEESARLQRNLTSLFYVNTIVMSVCSRAVLEPIRAQVHSLVRTRVQPSSKGALTTVLSPFVVLLLVCVKAYVTLPKVPWRVLLSDQKRYFLVINTLCCV